MGIVARQDVAITWPAAGDLGPGGGYDIVGNGGAGSVIDYAKPLNAAPIPAVPDGEGAVGFGAGAFGDEEFGLPSEEGFGEGAFGVGAFGVEEVDLLSHTLPGVPDGAWLFSVLGVDRHGLYTAPAIATAPLTLAAAPQPPTRLRAASISVAGAVTFQFARSTDDRP